MIGDCESEKGDAAARKYSTEAALLLRSRRSGTKRTALFGLFAKCRRLPRGFLWNTSLPPLFIGYFTFGKANVMITYGISGRRYAEITFKKAVFLWDLEFRN